MPSFGEKSQDKLDTCVPNIVKVMTKAIEIMDFSVIYGHRGKLDQEKAFIEGHSKKHWPDSLHNSNPSKAIDIAPYPIDWSNRPKAVARFYLLAGVVLTVAFSLGVKLRWGGDWDGDWDLFDQNFDDLGHFEEVG